MRFEPVLVVWHNDWRTPAQLRRLYWRYGRWQGAFYAKYLLQGDRRVLRFLRADVGFLMRTLSLRLLRRPTVPVMSALLPVLGIPLGMWEGRRFRGGSGMRETA
jgi:hypothetical protein